MFFLSTIIRAGGTTLLSLILGALAMGYSGYYYPDMLDWMLTIASSFKDILTNSANTGDSEMISRSASTVCFSKLSMPLSSRKRSSAAGP